MLLLDVRPGSSTALNPRDREDRSNLEGGSQQFSMRLRLGAISGHAPEPDDRNKDFKDQESESS
jgi:hypothetical protein